MTSKVQTKAEVFERLRALAPRLLELGVQRIGVFGSFVRDAAMPDSDVDFLVEFAPGRKSFDRFMQLSFMLEDALQRRIEVVTTEALSPHLESRILESVEYVSNAA